ncbi:hypothetical protein PUN28_006053 [Cardiocondyla obscurior]|uniref:Uncharacterized protein n=1 Tax=Cardiocondyla obscurior TaxID=286306 RepID=A0AAW2G928_9HYME
MAGITRADARNHRRNNSAWLTRRANSWHSLVASSSTRRDINAIERATKHPVINNGEANCIIRICHHYVERAHRRRHYGIALVNDSARSLLLAQYPRFCAI